MAEWPDDGTDEDQDEWTRGFVERLHEIAGLEALAKIARQCLAELTEAHAEAAGEVRQWLGERLGALVQ